MIVANEKGYSVRQIESAVAGEGFFLIIVFGHEIDKLEPGRWEEVSTRWQTRLYPGGRFIIADQSHGIGKMPFGIREHSWSPTSL